MGDPKSNKNKGPRLRDIYIPGYGLPWKERLWWPKMFLGSVAFFLIGAKISFEYIKPRVREEMRIKAEEQSKWEFEQLVELERSIIAEEKERARAKAKAEQERAPFI